MAWATPVDFSSGEIPTHTKFNILTEDLRIHHLSHNDDGSLSHVYHDYLVSNFTKTSDTTFADVGELGFSIGASEIWSFYIGISLVSPTAADVKFNVTVPAGASGRVSALNRANAITTGSAAIGTTIDLQTFDTEDLAVGIWGTVQNSTTAGTVQLQAAQNTSNATALTIYANSFIVAFQKFV